jgi:hypothetical protein
MVTLNDKLDTIGHPRKAAFLSAYRQCGSVREAAKVAGISRSTHYNWWGERSAEGDEYRVGFFEAQLAFKDYLQDEAHRRAIIGTSKLRTYKGQPIFVWKDLNGEIVPAGDPAAVHQEPLFDYKFSDRLLLALLKAHIPEKFNNPQPSYVSESFNHYSPRRAVRELTLEEQRAELFRLVESLGAKTEPSEAKQAASGVIAEKRSFRSLDTGQCS